MVKCGVCAVPVQMRGSHLTHVWIPACKEHLESQSLIFAAAVHRRLYVYERSVWVIRRSLSAATHIYRINGAIPSYLSQAGRYMNDACKRMGQKLVAQWGSLKHARGTAA